MGDRPDQWGGWEADSDADGRMDQSGFRRIFFSAMYVVHPLPSLLFSPAVSKRVSRAHSHTALLCPPFPFCPSRSDKMTIAPGVDLALMGAVCVCFVSIVQSRKGLKVGTVPMTTGSVGI